ncbi:VOC family protein [Paenibacillus aurantiacus]|uniref:VOC family protein n=1 Tax=Paenibacillus aurantiacus TaxID=1936118 RepID=A0ABV5KM10_9BACL
MIKNLYETHLQVQHLQRSIDFYQALGLTLALEIPERKLAFFYIGEERQMLGLWEVPAGQSVHRRHFAFGTELSLLTGAFDWLKERGIEPLPAFGKAPLEPVVHPWMPAAAVYFPDPDENELELIAWLPDQPLAIETVPYLNEWNNLVAASQGAQQSN